MPRVRRVHDGSVATPAGVATPSALLIHSLRSEIEADAGTKSLKAPRRFRLTYYQIDMCTLSRWFSSAVRAIGTCPDLNIAFNNSQHYRFLGPALPHPK